MTEVRRHVHALINRQLRETELNNEMLLAEDLGLDSKDMLELVMSIETEFSLEFRVGEAERLRTVGDIVALVEARLNERHGCDSLGKFEQQNG